MHSQTIESIEAFGIILILTQNMNSAVFVAAILLLCSIFSSSLNPAEKQVNLGVLSAFFSKMYIFLPNFYIQPFPKPNSLDDAAFSFSFPTSQLFNASEVVLDSANTTSGSSSRRRRRDMSADTQESPLGLSKRQLLVDNFITSDESRRLKALGMAAYTGRSQPKATSFSYQVPYLGMTYPSAVEASSSGSIRSEDARLFLSVSERIRHNIVSSFKLNTQLYHHFSHIVCRSPTVEAPLVSEGQYLPAHSDSCWLNITTGTCDYSSSAFTWRHYTSLLYLHDDFEGGEFFFSKSKKDITPETWIHPKQNRMVAFSAGEENIHGVRQTSRGVRCILEQWFTIDPSYRDVSYSEASAHFKR